MTTGMADKLTVPERVLRKDRVILIISLIGLTGLAWLYLYLLAADMAAGDMRLMGMGKMGVMTGPMPWDGKTFLLMGLMWWIMMIGMMVPSAAPMILLFARVQRRNLPHENPALRITLFTLSYLLLWLLFSVGATWLQWWLSERVLLSPMMKTVNPWLGAVIFMLAGLYQLTPLKRACLAHCQAPLQFLTTHWRKGNTGALHVGLRHGAYCVGCCWSLMLLLFVGGVMNLLWIATIAMLVLVEKILPPGRSYKWISGTLLIFLALFFFGTDPSTRL
ncbi:MAG: DUF2182 domain-containing protein [Gammaproteobacteria bacterium]|nr:DUF2182 domain-containing protein [Gammaproteobacteria bacterium]